MSVSTTPSFAEREIIMSAAEQRAKSSKMAADLVKRGIYHGRRMTSPYPNSGGTTMVHKAGSAKYQRRIIKQRAKNSNNSN